MTKSLKQLVIHIVYELLNNKDTNNKETDTVISTIELIELFSKFNFEFELIKESQNVFYSLSKFVDIIHKNNFSLLDDLNKLEKIYSYDSRDLQIFFEADEYFSSNGYAEFLIKKIIQDLSDNNQNLLQEKFKIERKILRNTDMREVILHYEDKILIKFAVIYGFRNIQYILKNIKAKKEKFEYSYIEIMACPGGCLNGGELKSDILTNFNRRSNETKR